jgi:hypothetical protein
MNACKCERCLRSRYIEETLRIGTSQQIERLTEDLLDNLIETEEELAMARAYIADLTEAPKGEPPTGSGVIDKRTGATP